MVLFGGISSVFAQTTNNTLPQNGNVGVGTMNPQVKLQVIGKTNLQGTLTVDSAMTLHDSLTVKKTLNVAKTIRVGGNALLKKRLTVKQDVLIGGKTTLTGTTKMLGNAKILGTTILEKRLTVKQDLLIGGKATFSQFSRFDKNVKVKGITTLQNKLNVTGIATFKDRLLVLKSGRFKSKLTVDGFTRIKGNARLDGTVKFTALADTAAAAQAQFLMVQPNGQIKSLKKSALITLFYEPKICQNLTANDLPQWFAKRNTSFKTLYTGVCFPTRVGIGTTTPKKMFHLTGDAWLEKNVDILKNLRVGVNALNFGKLNSLNNNIWTTSKDLTLQGGTSNNTLINPSGGNVGIGVASPKALLHIKETGVNIEALRIGEDDGRTMFFAPHLGNGGYNPISRSGDQGIIFSYQNFNTGGAGFVIAPHSPKAKGIRIAPNGNVGIGTGDPQAKLDVAGKLFVSGTVGIGTIKTTGYRLSVEGRIRARGIRVDNPNIIWADFVFSKNYHLSTLSEVEKYIDKHGHLPNIPSAAKIREEGINLAEMDALLLQKIEELTLYTIALKKENEIHQLKMDQIEKN